MLRLMMLLTVTFPFLLSAAEPGSAAYTSHPLGSTKAPYGFIEHLPYPATNAASKTVYPLVFFLHGHGELGDSNVDLPQLAKHGPFKHLVAGDAIGKMLEQNRAIVIAPQGLKSDSWFRPEQVLATLAYVVATYPVDKSRIYVTGLSMGGGGTWALCMTIPEQIAAAVPICGAGNVSSEVAKLRGIPLWTYHSIDDSVVKFPLTSQAWYDQILPSLGVKRNGGVMGGLELSGKTWTGTVVGKDAGKEWKWTEGEVPAGKLETSTLNLTVYPNGGHDSWSRAYANPAMWTWMFAQKKKSVSGQLPLKP